MKKEESGLELSPQRGDSQHVVPVATLAAQEAETLGSRAKHLLIRTLPLFAVIDNHDLVVVGAAHWLAGAHLVIYIVALLYFLVKGTLTEVGRKYLALPADVDPSAVTCEKVPLAISGVFIADKHGTWSTDEAFDQSTSTFQLTMTGTRVTEEQFTASMQNLTAQIQVLGKKMLDMDVISQHFAWSLFHAYYPATEMDLKPIASLDLIFANLPPIEQPRFLSQAGQCHPPTILRFPTYNTKDVTITTYCIGDTTKIDIMDDGYNVCPDQFTKNSNVFNLRESGDKSFELDLVSAAFAFALNYGILDTDMLILLRTTGRTYDTLGRVHFEQWVSPDYPGMQHVSCSISSGKPRVCFVVVGGFGDGGSTLTYPVFTTSDTDFNADRQRINPTAIHACLCPSSQHNVACNWGHLFQLSVLFPQNGNDEDIISAAWRLHDMSGNAKATVANLGYTMRMFVGFYNSRLDAWKGGEPLRGLNYQTIQWDGPVVDIQSFAEYNRTFAELLTGVSILALDLEYLGGRATLNVHGVTLSGLATHFYNASDDDAGEVSPHPELLCRDSVFQAEALIKMRNSALLSAVFLALAVVGICEFLRRTRGKRPVPLTEKVHDLQEEVKELRFLCETMKQELKEVRTGRVSSSSSFSVDAIPPHINSFFESNPLHSSKGPEQLEHRRLKQ